MTYSDYCRQLFGHPMLKLTINAGFTCPNRDGTLGFGGCTFCNNDAFNPAYCQPHKSITQQIDDGIRFHAHRRRHHNGGYLAYFQAYSNTYAPLPVLCQRYTEALVHPAVEGLIISTRPDCVDDSILDLLADLSQHHYVMIEYGIESCYDRTLQLIHRGHDYDCTRRTIQTTARRGIACGGHLILGLPGESRTDMLAEADMLSMLPLTTLKLHQLQILRGTTLERLYASNPASLPSSFTLEEYVSLLADFLDHLRPDIIVERYASEVPPRHQAAPQRGWHHPDGTPVRADELARLVAARRHSGHK